MSLQEKKVVFNVITSILIIAGYMYYAFVMRADENLPLQNDAQFWAEFSLRFIVVTIIIKIIFHILFHIVLKGMHRDEEPDFMDEYDKLIEMRAERNGNYFFIFGLMCSMIPVAMGYPIYVMFLIILSSGFIGGTLGDLWKIYYYRKGI